MPYALEPESATAVLEPPRERYVLEPEPPQPESSVESRSFIPFGAGPPGPPGAISSGVTGGMRHLGRRVRSLFESVAPPTEAMQALQAMSPEQLAKLSQDVGAVSQTGEPLITSETVQAFPEELANAMLVLSFIPVVPGPPAEPPAALGMRAEQIAATREAIKQTAQEIRAREFQRGMGLLEPPGGLPKPPPEPVVTAPPVVAKPMGTPPVPAPVSRGLHLPTFLPDELAALDQIRSEVSQGTAGFRMPVEAEAGQGGTRPFIGVPSTFPPYFQNKGYTKAQVLRILDEVQAGNRITEKQRAVLDDLLEGFQAEAERAARPSPPGPSPELARYRLEEAAPGVVPEAPPPEAPLPSGATDFPFRLEPSEASPQKITPAQVTMPGMPRVELPTDPRKAISPEGPMPLEQATAEAADRAKQVPLVEFEHVGGPVQELGAGVPLTRQSFFQWQVAWERMKAKLQPIQAEAQQLAPKVTFAAPARDMGFLSMFGTPSNRLTRYGPVAEAAINDLNLTEMRQIRAIGQRNEADATQGFAKMSPREVETFWDVFEGKPIQDILARPDLSQGTKEAAQYFRAKLDLDRGTIIQLQREWLRSAMEAKVEAQLRTEGFARAGRRRTKAEMETLSAEVAKRTEEELVKAFPETWGIKDYLPHLFPSEYRVLVKNPAGGLDFLGGANSKWEAQAIIAKHFVEHPSTPEASYQVETRVFMNPDVVRVSTPRRWKLIHDLSKAAEVTKEDVADAMKGIIGTKERKAKWWGALLHRAGVPGYSKDLQWVMQTYNAGLVRWATITELRRRIEPTLRELRNRGQTQLAGEIEANFKILSGYKSPTSDLLDTTLANTPGLRVIAQPFALERWTNRLKGFTATAFLKLSPRFHFLNRFQIVQTLWPIVDTADLAAGLRLSQSAEGRAILDQYGVRFLAARGKIAEAPGLRILSPRFLERLNLLAPETSNQEIAFLTVYQKGLTMGMLPSKAADYALLRGNLFTQFVALRTDQPRALYRDIRSGMPAPVKSLAFQFQRFNVKDFEIGMELLRSKNVSGATKWLTGHFLMGGARAFTNPFLWIPGAGYLSFKVYNAIKEEYGDEIAKFLYYGLPSLLNMDLSYSIQFFNPPYGASLAEKIGNQALGPLGALATSMGRAALDTKGIEPAAHLRMLRAVVQRTPSLRWIEGLEKVWTGNYDFRDPAGRLRFHGELKDVLMQLGAFRSLRQAEQDQWIEALTDIKDQRDHVLDEAAAISLQRLKVKQPPLPENLTKAKATVDQWNTMFPEFPITEQDLITRQTARVKTATMPQQTRQFLRAPKTLRPAVLEWLRPTPQEVRP